MASDELLRRGISALKSGRKVEARRLFLEVIQQDGRNEMAWLWLSGAVDPDDDRRICLQNVLSINPHNQTARQGLESLDDGANKRATRASASSPPGSRVPRIQAAKQSGAMEERGVPPASGHDDRTSAPGTKAGSKKPGAGRKWFYFGALGLVLVLLRGYWLAHTLWFAQPPVVPSPPSTSAVTITVAPEQAYASLMAPALENLVVWAYGPLADWDGLLAETVPGTSGEASRGSELSACIQMAKACAADIAMWDRMRETFLPVASKLGKGGDEVLSSLDGAIPPSSLAQTHEQVVACVEYETELAKSVEAFLGGSETPDVVLESDLCDHLSSEISQLAQFVQDSQ